MKQGGLILAFCFLAATEAQAEPGYLRDLLLGQSDLPAQPLHVLKNLADPLLSPGYDGASLDAGNVERLGKQPTDWVPAAAAQEELPVVQNLPPVVRGATTDLTARTVAAPRFDGAAGKTELVLRENGSRRVMTVPGLWDVLGFAASAHAYVLAGKFQVGAFLPYAEIAYLDEQGSSLRPSRCCEDWYALAAIWGPYGRYVAFVARDGDQPYAVEVLDTVSDRLRRLGPAPQPPPLARDEWETARTAGPLEPWEWGDYGSDGVVSIDPGIVTFRAEDVVQVSYGNDGYRRRARRRTRKTWRIAGAAH